MESLDMTKANIDKVAELFPQVVTEVADPTGAVDSEGKPLLRKAIDFEKLKLVLSAGTGSYVVADDERERYEFTWVGKRQAMIDAAMPIRKTLRPCPEQSKDWATTENLYIEGDNLEVLKLLQESYLGKVKMIYIDPPYNTGKDFIYKDNFTQSREEYEEELDMFDEEGNRLFQNTETNGRFHSDWCSMIYPRLQLARNLLTDDGVIFISIGDEEVGNLRKIADEIFGEANFRNQISIRRGAKSVQAQFDTWDKLGQNVEYLLLYTNDYSYRFPKQMKPLEESRSGMWNNHWRGTDRPTMRYEILGVNPTSGQWRWSKDRSLIAIENYNKMLAETGCSEDNITQYIIDEWYLKQLPDTDMLRLSATGKPEHYIPPTNETLLNNSWTDLLVGSSSEIGQLFDTKVFDTAKLTAVIKRMLNFVSKDSIILDFFSGSATTAHAVMQLNAEDGGNRKFIMVQLPEVCDEKSEAAKAGYATICEIGKERIRRAGAKIEEEQKTKTDGLFAEDAKPLDTGFRVFKLDSTNMKDVYYAAGQLSQKDLWDTVSNIKEDRSDIDLLYGCLLDWGVQLTMPHTTEKIEGFTVHTVDSPLTDEIDLIACFDSEVSETVVRTIAKRKPMRALFRDSSFADSANKINVFEIFKSISPDTTVKVI